MPKYRINANNKMGTSDLYHRRLLYRFFALSFDIGPIIQGPGIKDYWSFENYFYGKVDANFIPVMPNIQNLVQVEGQSGNVLMFDFVAESFEKFKSFFTMPLKFGKIEDGTPISRPKPTRAFDNTLLKYQNHLMSFVDKYNNFLFSTVKSKEINEPKKYIREFFKYYFSSNENILRSSYYMSPSHSGLSSGLSIEIANLDPSNDKQKMEMIESNNFGFYQQAAINSGFLIDKNIPWRLNIDLKSPIIVEKYSDISVTGIPFVTDIFSKYFSKVHRGESLELIESLFYGYRNFYERLPTKGMYASGPGSEPLLAPEVECGDSPLPPPSEGIISSALNSMYWIGKYIEMKNKESGTPYNAQEIEMIKRNTFSASTNTEDYIDKKFGMPWIHAGSTVYERLRKEFQENDDFPLDNFSDYVKMVVQNSINSIY